MCGIQLTNGQATIIRGDLAMAIDFKPGVLQKISGGGGQTIVLKTTTAQNDFFLLGEYGPIQNDSCQGVMKFGSPIAE